MATASGANVSSSIVTPRYDPSLYVGLPFDPFHPITGYAVNDVNVPFLASRPLTWFEVWTSITSGRVELLMRTPSSKEAYVESLKQRAPLYRSTADIVRHRFLGGITHPLSDSDTRLCCDAHDIKLPTSDQCESLSSHSSLCPASPPEAVCVHFITRSLTTPMSPTTPSTPTPTIIEAKSPCHSNDTTTTVTTITPSIGNDGQRIAKLVWTLNEFPYALETGVYHSLLWSSDGELTPTEVEREIVQHFNHSLRHHQTYTNTHNNASATPAPTPTTPTQTTHEDNGVGTSIANKVFDWCWFVNPVALQSVRDIWHAQVFWRRKPN